MLNTKNVIIAALATIVIIDEAVIIPLNNKRARKALEKSTAVSNYLASMLDKAGVELTEFDKTAMLTIAE